MLAHAFLSLLVFENGFIQIRCGIFEFLTRYLSYYISHDTQLTFTCSKAAIENLEIVVK